MHSPRKSLGQHWLRDNGVLSQIAEAAQITSKDTVLEVGPGHGSLTKHLVERAGQVTAVEVDKHLAKSLAHNFRVPNLRIVAGDILEYDLAQLPRGYKVVANIPYYLTGNLLRLLSETDNRPQKAVLLVQKEVAERLAAGPGNMSIISVAVQLHYEPKLGIVAPAELFIPPPKVDSQVIILTRREKPLFKNIDNKLFFRLIKAGFSEKRKKLRSSLSGGLGISKTEADKLLREAGTNGDLRGEALSLQQWHSLYLQYLVKENLHSLL